jgi:hypothetical protein
MYYLPEQKLGERKKPYIQLGVSPLVGYLPTQLSTAYVHKKKYPIRSSALAKLHRNNRRDFP